MTRHVMAAAIALLAVATRPEAAGAQSGDDAVTSANRGAYEVAMKCFVANGHARGLRSRAGDPAKAEAYGVKAREALGLATSAGHMLGLSDDQIKQDANDVEDRELPHMIQDNGYFIRTVADCKALGMM